MTIKLRAFAPLQIIVGSSHTTVREHLDDDRRWARVVAVDVNTGPLYQGQLRGVERDAELTHELRDGDAFRLALGWMKLRRSSPMPHAVAR